MSSDEYIKDIDNVFSLFSDSNPINYEIINTSHGEWDFREVIIVTWETKEKLVIKLADNEFTFQEKIKMWKQCVKEHRKLGYYCPNIFPTKNGDYPTVAYKGRQCVVYAEEYATYCSAEDFISENEIDADKKQSYMEQAFKMVAKIAAQKSSYSHYLSGYCMYDKFCESDEMDEVLENALVWKQYAELLPIKYSEQVERIWARWLDNRNCLEKLYDQLPTSIFQADLNSANILLDETMNFVGVYDFNLCGKDVFLNYLFREIHGKTYQDEINQILRILKIVQPFYHFSKIEKEAAPLLYRCIKPLWYYRIEELKRAANDDEKIKDCLEKIEYAQTVDIDF